MSNRDCALSNSRPCSVRSSSTTKVTEAVRASSFMSGTMVNRFTCRENSLGRQAVSSLVVAVALVASVRPALAANPPQPVAAEHGMVVAAHRIAAQVGVDILKAGGNAVDAAVAVGYALAVVYPEAGNIGGGGFMTLRLASGRETFLDFRERAPLAATANMYLDAKGDVIKGLSTDGYLSVGVPGTVMGLETARERWGTMTRAALLAPAITLAAKGFVLTEGDTGLTEAGDYLRGHPDLAKHFLKPDGSTYAPGDRLSQPELAATLRLIAHNGIPAFYRGPIADAIVAASAANHGILAKADF